MSAHQSDLIMTRSTALSAVRPIPRRGLAREQAAMYLGIFARKFNELVRDGRMPRPKRIVTGCADAIYTRSRGGRPTRCGGYCLLISFTSYLSASKMGPITAWLPSLVSRYQDRPHANAMPVQHLPRAGIQYLVRDQSDRTIPALVGQYCHGKVEAARKYSGIFVYSARRDGADVCINYGMSTSVMITRGAPLNCPFSCDYAVSAP